MRDYETSKGLLRGIAAGFRAKGNVHASKTCDDAADAIEELLAKVQTWISVEERLPEPFVCVLAHIPGEKPFPTVKSAFLEKNGLWYSNGFRYKPEEVTHWCEMPEPPKGVE